MDNYLYSQTLGFLLLFECCQSISDFDQSFFVKKAYELYVAILDRYVSLTATAYLYHCDSHEALYRIEPDRCASSRGRLRLSPIPPDLKSQLLFFSRTPQYSFILSVRIIIYKIHRLAVLGNKPLTPTTHLGPIEVPTTQSPVSKLSDQLNGYHNHFHHLSSFPGSSSPVRPSLRKY